jgi:hypothetical protein
VASSAATLAGLILVFLGATANSFSSYDKAAQTSVRSKFQAKAWFAFVGFAFALLATLLALVAKWLANDCVAWTALFTFVISLVWALAVALSAVREIR